MFIAIAASWVAAIGTANALASNDWTSAGDLPAVQNGATLTALSNGGALVAGGEPVTRGFPPPDKPTLATSYVLDPRTSSWHRVADMPEGHASAVAILLPSGQVMVMGGYADTRNTTTAKVAIFDPASQTWRDAAPLGGPIVDAAATLLAGGRVLVTGGISRSIVPGTIGSQDHLAPILSAATEIFDPATGSWASAPKMLGTRASQASIRLGDGTVLVVGGTNGINPLATASLFDPSSSRWLALPPLPKALGYPAIALLADGNAIVVGSYGTLATSAGPASTPGQTGTLTEIFNTKSRTWSSAQGPPSQSLTGGTGFLVAHRQAFFLSFDGTSVQGLLYDATIDRWSVTTTLSTNEPYSPVVVKLSDGRVLVLAGTRTALYGGSLAPASGGAIQKSFLESTNTAVALTTIALFLAALLGAQRLRIRLRQPA